MRYLFLSALLCATPVAATEHNRPADITVECNANGAVVRTAAGATYYLGKSCDAARAGGGEGRWWFAASAFIVEINGQSVRFANDLNCDITYCRP